MCKSILLSTIDGSISKIIGATTSFFLTNSEPADMYEVVLGFHSSSVLRFLSIGRYVGTGVSIGLTLSDNKSRVNGHVQY